MERSILS